jgi:hypothetical protein
MRLRKRPTAVENQSCVWKTQTVMAIGSVRKAGCAMMRIWTGIILFSNLLAVLGDKNVSFTPAKPWIEYTGNSHH